MGSCPKQVFELLFSTAIVRITWGALKIPELIPNFRPVKLRMGGGTQASELYKSPKMTAKCKQD